MDLSFLCHEKIIFFKQLDVPAGPAVHPRRRRGKDGGLFRCAGNEASSGCSCLHGRCLCVRVEGACAERCQHDNAVGASVAGLPRRRNMEAGAEQLFCRYRLVTHSTGVFGLFFDSKAPPEMVCKA